LGWHIVTVEGVGTVIPAIRPSSTYLLGAPATATMTMANDDRP
jgi:hypothetical protein